MTTHVIWLHLMRSFSLWGVRWAGGGPDRSLWVGIRVKGTLPELGVGMGGFASFSPVMSDLLLTELLTSHQHRMWQQLLLPPPQPFLQIHIKVKTPAADIKPQQSEDLVVLIVYTSSVNLQAWVYRIPPHPSSPASDSNTFASFSSNNVSEPRQAVASLGCVSPGVNAHVTRFNGTEWLNWTSPRPAHAHCIIPHTLSARHEAFSAVIPGGRSRRCEWHLSEDFHIVWKLLIRKMLLGPEQHGLIPKPSLCKKLQR